MNPRRSALYMGGGLALVGAAGYAFVALAGHTLPPAETAALASVYLLVNIIGPGVFSAVEQETSRAISARLAAGGEVGPVTRHAWLLAGMLLVATVVVLLAISPVLTTGALAGNWGLFVAVVLSAVTSAAVCVVRGLLGGRQRFDGYAATLATEGLGRILPCVVLAVSGLPNAIGYAVAFAAGSGFGALAGWLWLRRADAPAGSPRAGSSRDGSSRDGEPAAGSVWQLARAASFLVGGLVLMLVVMNIAPVVVTARLGDGAVAAAAFASAFVLARIPLFLFAPLQAMLLPGLTEAATLGQIGVVRRRLRLIMLAVLAIGLPAVLASFTVGPWAVEVFFGARVRLPGSVVGLLGVGTVGLMVALMLQPALIAFGRHRMIAVAWLSGTVPLVALLALPVDPIDAGVIAQLTGVAVVVVIMVTVMARTLRASPAPAATRTPAPAG